VLLRAARREVARRRSLLGGASGPELDDLAHQAADDALLAILDSLDTCRSASRFTTWADRFVINHVSLKTRRHLWSGPRVPFDDVNWDRLPDRLLPSADRRSEQRAQTACSQNGGSKRPLRRTDEATRESRRRRLPGNGRKGSMMTDRISLEELPRSDPADHGCEAGVEIIDEYVELELAGRDAAARFPGLAAHLRSCPSSTTTASSTRPAPSAGPAARSVLRPSARRDGDVRRDQNLATNGVKRSSPDALGVPDVKVQCQSR
jgi:hypothetical protein